MISPPLLAPLPTLPPLKGEYGRLDSPWRVRSHLETPGQPKAGTVTITRPHSPWALAHWEHDEKKLRRWGSTETAVGLRRRGIRVIINDQWRAAQRESSTKLVLFNLKRVSAVQWMKWRVWQMPFTNFWGNCDPNWILKSSFVWNKSNGEKKRENTSSSSVWCLWPVQQSSKIHKREQNRESSLQSNA